MHILISNKVVKDTKMKREPFFSLFVKCHNFGHFVHFVMHPTIKTACARPEIFQDVFKLHDRDFKQCFEYEKATICDYIVLAINMKAYFII